MRRFDYSFLNNGLLPANLVNLTSSIATLKTIKPSTTKLFGNLPKDGRIMTTAIFLL